MSASMMTVQQIEGLDEVRVRGPACLLRRRDTFR
jgi:hypothetical protein